MTWFFGGDDEGEDASWPSLKLTFFTLILVLSLEPFALAKPTMKQVMSQRSISGILTTIDDEEEMVEILIVDVTTYSSKKNEYY